MGTNLLPRLSAGLLIGLMLTFGSGGIVHGRSKLPPCSSGWWDNCQGTATYANGDKYVGEFKDGKRNGQGTYTLASGDKYVGEYKDGKRNGQGTYTFADGDKYVGEFKDDKRDGHGTVTYAKAEKYVGEFKDDKRNGPGTATYANGMKYVGEFKDGKRNGRGTGYAADGSILSSGLWTDDKFAAAVDQINMKKRGGVYVVPVLINNAITLDFVVDSGASDVSVPADVVMTLMRSGTLKETDFLGQQTYVLADGSKVPSETFRIRSLKSATRSLRT